MSSVTLCTIYFASEADKPILMKPPKCINGKKVRLGCKYGRPFPPQNKNFKNLVATLYLTILTIFLTIELICLRIVRYKLTIVIKSELLELQNCSDFFLAILFFFFFSEL